MALAIIVRLGLGLVPEHVLSRHYPTFKELILMEMNFLKKVSRECLFRPLGPSPLYFIWGLCCRKSAAGL